MHAHSVNSLRCKISMHMWFVWTSYNLSLPIGWKAKKHLQRGAPAHSCGVSYVADKCLCNPASGLAHVSGRHIVLNHPRDTHPKWHRNNRMSLHTDLLTFSPVPPPTHRSFHKFKEWILLSILLPVWHTTEDWIKKTSRREAFLLSYNENSVWGGRGGRSR